MKAPLVFVLGFAVLPLAAASGATIQWTDWTTTGGPNEYLGEITTPTANIDVTYTNTNGISFFQPTGGTDY